MANAGVSTMEYAKEQNIMALKEQHLNIDLLNGNHKVPTTVTTTSYGGLVSPITSRVIDSIENIKLKKHLTEFPIPMNKFVPTLLLNHSDQATCARYNYANGQFRASLFRYGEY